jgi:rubrerythrin
METQKETVKTIQGRLTVLRKSLVGEENSVQYYLVLHEKTPDDKTEETLGIRRMYRDLCEEEKKHVLTLKSLIAFWEDELRKMQS